MPRLNKGNDRSSGWGFPHYGDLVKVVIGTVGLSLAEKCFTMAIGLIRVSRAIKVPMRFERTETGGGADELG
jgi:hypothetical protein